VVEQALWQRGYRPNQQVTGLIHHSDAGSQYTSIAFTDRLAQAGIAPSIGTVADAYDNALAESTIGLFKTELIDRNKPWKTFTDVEFATAEWIDWYNHHRIHGALGHTTPAEYEAAYHHRRTPADEPVSA
jgi:putative transposase